MSNDKRFHDYQSDLASLKEGMTLLEQNLDQETKNKIAKLIIEKCQKLSSSFETLRNELEEKVRL